jgi:pimeloyl-ACP methyl ester carboxylesterase
MNSDIQPFFREAGAGPGVVCLHSNASSASQWRALMDLLAPNYHVLAADSYGHGKSPAPPAGGVTLREEAALLEPVYRKAGDRFALVGHSYGAAIALITAISRPERVRALALFEPTLFSLVNADTAPPNAADGIRDAVLQSIAALEAGDPDQAARSFIDYWMGQSVWDHMPAQRKPAIVQSIVNIRSWGLALMEEPTPLEAFAKLDIPVLYMTGKNSPASSLAVARLLVRTLPNVQVLEFDRMGHMGPITHPDLVNQAIAGFLGRLPPAAQP